MRTRFSDRGFDAAERRLKGAGRDVMRGAASEMQREAQRLAPVDSGTLRRSIELQPTPDGARVVCGVFYGVFLEYGTGAYAEGGGRSTPWVYFSDTYGWVTTNGARPQPFMRPAYDAGVSEFYRQKRRRGL